ncbi:MAG TPA: 4-hydroxy-3-methylbut-2-enyl diphosphate reductase [Roseiarcus sp.]|nr:4-hydroxy-3-methylbut-2-enyl diphosphate reductase [Roseiarcus sp.]
MPRKPKLKVVLCAPRGFCAGVVRAIDVVERALAIFGPPVYVRHEIVHNKYVVESLVKKGAIFVESLDEVDNHDAPVIFSAHGVAKSVPAEAEALRLFTIDATCPLVTKVHREAQSHFKRGRKIILIGHAGHPEVVGTLGQLPAGAIALVGSVEEVDKLPFSREQDIAYITQTTLSVDDTHEIVEAILRRFPNAHQPPRADICYATTNRQEAVKRAAPMVEAMIVVGSANSSNSQRLREVAERAGVKIARLVDSAEHIDWDAFGEVSALAVTAGASAPEILVEQVLDAFAARFEMEIETLSTADESVFFPLPRALREETAPSGA